MGEGTIGRESTKPNSNKGGGMLPETSPKGVQREGAKNNMGEGHHREGEYKTKLEQGGGNVARNQSKWKVPKPTGGEGTKIHIKPKQGRKAL